MTRMRFCALPIAALAMLIAGCVSSFAAGSEPQPVPVTCTLEPGPVRTVTRVIDGETVALDDGSEVRLIGALAPRASDAGAVHGAWPAEQDAIRTLTALVLGRTVKLAYGGRHRDRYGRHLAHVFVNGTGTQVWVQGEMLSAGVARAYGLPGSFVCGPELIVHEHEARTARRGVWDTAFYHAKPAHLTALLMSRRSQFEIVEGTVSAISRTKSGLYVNFGSDAKTDFTVRIGKDVLSANADWDRSLSEITGKTIAARGWIERRNGPMIDIRDPSQFEILNPAAPAAPALLPPIANGPAEQPAPDNAGVKPSEPAKQNNPAVPEQKPPGDVDL